MIASSQYVMCPPDSEMDLSCMHPAIRLTAFTIEGASLELDLTPGAPEAIRVIVALKRLDPFISRLNGIAASVTLNCEE